MRRGADSERGGGAGERPAREAEAAGWRQAGGAGDSATRGREKRGKVLVVTVGLQSGRAAQGTRQCQSQIGDSAGASPRLCRCLDSGSPAPAPAAPWLS